MNGDMLFMILFGVILIGYIFLYVKGRKYLEGFQGTTGPTVADIYPSVAPIQPQIPEIDSKPGRVLMEYTSMDPATREATQGLDEEEYDMVYQNESDRELSTDLRNKLMSQRPMEWSGLPPSSSQFQAGLRESFQNASMTVPDSAKLFMDVNGDNMVPPDTDSMEMEERKILQTYKPPTAADLDSYSAEEDPEKMIRRIYKTKGLIPTIAHKEGTNVYEIVGVRTKDEKIVYEDEEAPASTGPVRGAGEANIVVPAVAYDTAALKDVYYDTNPSGRVRTGKWDFHSWTPGLDQMFSGSSR
jgi:hypothetical protein